MFVGGFTLEGAEAVAGDLELDIVDGVESLLNDNLLRTEAMAGGEPRFGMLGTIRDYALERLSERGDDVRRRHARFYVELAEEAEPALLGPQQVSWLERLDAELANIRAAMAWATEGGEAEIGLRIGAALWRFWQLRGSAAEGRERLERLLALRSGSKAARAMARSRIASLAVVQGDHEAARRIGEASLVESRRAADDNEVVLMLGVLCLSAVATGDIDRAHGLAQEGLEIARRIGDLSTEVYATMPAGIVFAHRGEFDEAERLLEESVRAGRVSSGTSEASRTGAGRSAESRWPGATIRRRAVSSRRASASTVRSAIPWGISHSLSRLAVVFLELHDNDAARRLISESLAIEREVGDRPGQLFDIEVLAALAAEEGRPVRAVRLYACSSMLRAEVGRLTVEPGWPKHEHHIRRVRSALGEDAFAEAWEQGRAMTLDEALDYALEEAPTRSRHGEP